MSKLTIRNVAFWTTTVLGPASFVIGGVLQFLIQSDEARVGLEHLGYPLYFATILGVGKLLGVIAILAPGFRA